MNPPPVSALSANPRRKIIALGAAIVLPLLPLWLLITLTDAPQWRADALQGKSQRAALAIRDDVNPFQKWGTRVFTVPYLGRLYGRIEYFTQTAKGDKKDAFQQSLTALLRQYPQVDLFLLAHTNTYYTWVAELMPELRQHLRLVYNTGCYGTQQKHIWLGLGADTYVGHPGLSASPIFYYYFLRRWAKGETVKTALEQSNQAMQKLLMRGRYLGFSLPQIQWLWQESEAQSLGQEELNIDRI